MIRSLGSVFTFGLMEELTLETGKMASRKMSVSISCLTAQFVREDGKEVLVKSGSRFQRKKRRDVRHTWKMPARRLRK